MTKELTSNTSYLLCVRQHVSFLMWTSSGLLTNQVIKCWLNVGHIRIETCSLTHNKYDVFNVRCFIILILNLNTSGCLQSNTEFISHRDLRYSAWRERRRLWKRSVCRLSEQIRLITTSLLQSTSGLTQKKNTNARICTRSLKHAAACLFYNSLTLILFQS